MPKKKDDRFYAGPHPKDMGRLALIGEIKRLRRLSAEIYAGVLGYLEPVTSSRQANNAWARLADQLKAAAEGEKLPRFSLLPFHMRTIKDAMAGLLESPPASRHQAAKAALPKKKLGKKKVNNRVKKKR